MKKIIYFLFLFFFLLFANVSQAEVFDCGSTDFRFDADPIAEIKKNDYPALQCLGEKIINDCQEAKLLVNTLTKGDILYSIHKKSAGLCAVKLNFPVAEKISLVDNKIFANSFLSCPVAINQLKGMASYDSVVGDKKIAQALAVYAYVESGVDNPYINNYSCFGTYLDKAREAGFYKVGTSTDPRPVFFEIFTDDFLESIKSHFNLIPGYSVCDLDNCYGAKVSDCSFSFSHKAPNPYEALKIDVFKINYSNATRDNFDLKKAADEAKIFFDELKNNYSNEYDVGVDAGIVNKKWDELAQFSFLDKKIVLVRSGSFVVAVSFVVYISGSDVALIIDKIFNIINGNENSGSVNFVTNSVLPSIAINIKLLKPSPRLMDIAMSTLPFVFDFQQPKITPLKKDIGIYNDNKNQGLVYNIIDNTLYNRLKGRIILRVEGNGEAYYVSPIEKKAYYLGRPNDAFRVMREKGIGISNNDIAKIMPGFLKEKSLDTDMDKLSDLFEDAFGTNKHSKDTDGDSYNDFDEINNGYNPKIKRKKLVIDNKFSQKQRGKIFLQVNSKGEAWYVNPPDAKRYFLGRPDSAFAIMRGLGLGVSNFNFGKMFKIIKTDVSKINTLVSGPMADDIKNKVVMAIRNNNKEGVVRYFNKDLHHYLNYVMNNIPQDEKNRWADLIDEAVFLKKDTDKVVYRSKVIFAGRGNDVDYTLKKTADNRWEFMNL